MVNEEAKVRNYFLMPKNARNANNTNNARNTQKLNNARNTQKLNNARVVTYWGFRKISKGIRTISENTEMKENYGKSVLSL